MKDKLILFSVAFLQVFLVACNVIFISSGYTIPMLLTGFAISMMWSFNIKKIAIGSISDRVYYAVGAALGTYIGYLFSHYITHI